MALTAQRTQGFEICMRGARPLSALRLTREPIEWR